MINLRYKLNKATINLLTQYSSLLTTISNEFGLPSETFHITYLDEDQDHISITNTEDILTMIETNQFFQLYIHDKQEIADSIICDNLLDLTEGGENTNPQRNIQGIKFENLDRVKKNVEEYLDKMEKVWGDFKIKKEEEQGLGSELELQLQLEMENQGIQHNNFLNETIELVESKEINISKELYEPTADISQQKDMQKLIDDRITETIPLITSIIQKNLLTSSMSASSTSFASSPHNNVLEKGLRLKHKRINRLMQSYPLIPMSELTKIAEDTLDLEYDEIVTKFLPNYFTKI